MFLFFFFNDTATTEIYTLSLHDALPICTGSGKTTLLNVLSSFIPPTERVVTIEDPCELQMRDRKSTRLNSSHGYISYAVFCLKKKKQSFNALLLTGRTAHSTPTIAPVRP